jgi:lysophospholipase L1-like esterase
LRYFAPLCGFEKFLQEKISVIQPEKRLRLKNIYLSLFSLLLPLLTLAQPEIVDREKYPFINYAGNNIYTPNSSILMPVFRNLERLMKTGDRQINIVQIGDSHIQADILSNRMRQQLQDFFPGGNGGRGFIFPYSMAHTNTPYNYKVEFTGKWESCRNVQNKDCELGLAGISVTTYDSFCTLHVQQSESASLRYDCTRVRFFYSANDSDFEIKLVTDSLVIQSKSNLPGQVEWNLSSAVNSLDFQIKRIRHSNSSFSLFGLSMETRDPGIVYHAVGVNGAEVGSFAKCNLLPKQLQSLSPDMVVISLGTNDAFVKEFDSASFHFKYTQFLKHLKEELPGTPFLLTIPGDCFLNRRYANPANIKAREVIFSLAKENNCAVWDYYNTMGGFGSIQTWFKAGLTANDKVHYNITGYQIQGDLFLEAFIKAFDKYLDGR